MLWTVWLGLAVLLGLQIYIAMAHELEIPGFVLRQLESRLAESGLRVTFDRTSFDPMGRVLMENVKVSLPSFSEPVITARAVYVRVNPLMLIVGRVDPREIRVDDATATIPAMLSPSGRPEELVRSLHVILEPTHHSLTIQQLNARAAGIVITARGVVPMPRETKKPAGDALADFIAHQFPLICRQAVAWSEQLEQLENPSIEIELAPSESGAATIGISVLASAAHIEKPVAVHATDLRASTRLLLFGDEPSTHVVLHVGELQLPNETVAREVTAQAYGRLRLRESQFDLREITTTADSITVAGLAIEAPAIQLFPRPLPRVDARVVAHFLGSPVTVRGEVDYIARTAHANLEGEISRQVLDLISQRVGTDVRKYFDFESFTAQRAEVQFDPGWQFAKLSAQVRIPIIYAYGVTMQDGRTQFELAGSRFHAPEAFARVGNNFARGSYEHDLKTHEYRFLLDGQLRPLDIAKWFHEWWPNFFGQFDFTAAAPLASVDVRSAWRDGGRANVFVFADVAKPIIRGTSLDSVRTRLFVRPDFYDALEARITQGEGLAQGRFTYMATPGTHDWQTIDFAIDSSLDLKTSEQLLGSLGTKILAPFKLSMTPELKLAGHFSGPAAAEGAHEKLRVEARSAGEFRYYNFPLQEVSFVAALNDDEIIVDNIVATIGGGPATGKVRLWGADKQRRLGFDFALKDAGLGLVAAGVEEFFAQQENRPPAPPGKFVQQKANVRLTLAASAEGSYESALTFRGGGSVALQGAEIGEVPLLGTLSELLKFTALRFTEARANFKIEGPKLVFPELTLRGANSAIDAHGEYFLDRHQLEFNAKLFPFQESESLIKSVVGAVLSPLSNAFEVKLTGTLEKPHWALQLGSTHLIRALAGGEGAEKTPGTDEKATAQTAPAVEANQPQAAKP